VKDATSARHPILLTCRNLHFGYGTQSTDVSMNAPSLIILLASLVFLRLSAAAASDGDGTLLVPGACYVLSLPKSDSNRLIDRIELQHVQGQGKDNAPVGGPRIHLGIQPRGADDVIPSAVSAPCSGKGERLTCALTCNEASASDENGRIRIAPAGKDRLKLTIEKAPTLNACNAGESAIALPSALAHRSFVLRRAGSSDCFH
jgi:hypothetical protein